MRTIEDILTALQAIIDGAAADDGTERPLSDEEVQRYETLEQELATVRRNIEVRSRQEAYQTPTRTDLHVHSGVQTAVQATDEERAFTHYLRTGQPNSDLEFRAQAEGTGAAGGFLVPQGFLEKITERLKAFGGISGEAEHIATSQGNALPWPTNDDTAVLGEIVPENGAPAGGADLVFGQKTLGAFKYNSTGVGGLPLKVSYELAQDSAFNLEDFVQRKLAERIGRKQASDWAVGTGVGMPQGIMTGGTSGVIVGSNVTGISYAEMVSAVHAVDVAYRQDGESVWIMNDAILALIERMVDTTGRPLLNMSTDGIGGTPTRTLLGFRVIVDNTLPNSYGVAAKTLIFGNIKRGYLIRDVQEVVLVVLRELYAVTGQIGYMAWARADGIVQDTNAFTVIRGA